MAACIRAAGVIRALQDLDLETNTVVVSHNYTPSTARELKRERSPLLGAVAFFPERYGARIMDIATRLLRKEPVVPLNYTDHRWIGRDV